MSMVAKKKSPQNPAVLVRLDKEQYDALHKEANEEQRTLASYLRYLLTTHPKRKKR